MKKPSAPKGKAKVGTRGAGKRTSMAPAKGKGKSPFGKTQGSTVKKLGS